MALHKLPIPLIYDVAMFFDQRLLLHKSTRIQLKLAALGLSVPSRPKDSDLLLRSLPGDHQVTVGHLDSSVVPESYG